MNRAKVAAAVVVAGLLWSLACGSDASGPGTAATTAKVTDPSGDTFGADTARWDLTALTINRDSAGITVLLDFSATVISPVTGAANAMIAYVDFDVDQALATGFQSIVDTYRPGAGTTGLGADYELAMATYLPDSTVSVLDSSGTVMGQVRPVFNGNPGHHSDSQGVARRRRRVPERGRDRRHRPQPLGHHSGERPSAAGRSDSEGGGVGGRSPTVSCKVGAE